MELILAILAQKILLINTCHYAHFFNKPLSAGYAIFASCTVESISTSLGEPNPSLTALAAISLASRFWVSGLNDWINTLKAHKISISMDGRGRYLDNIFIERLWRSVKQEKLYRYSFETIEEVELALTEYFDYYNHRRSHQSFGYITPVSMYLGHNPKA